MSRLLIRNGRVVDPSQSLDQGMDMLIENGVVADIDERITTEKRVKMIDASGLVVAPGFIDLNASFGEPGFEYRETIRNGCNAAVAGGFTAVCLSPETQPVNDDPALTRFVRERGNEVGLAKVYPLGAVTRGLENSELAEMGEMQREGAVACSSGHRTVQDAQLMRRALEYAKSFDLTLAVCPVDVDLIGDGCVHEGLVSTQIGLRGIPAAAEEVMVARDIVLSELTGGRLHLQHLSTSGGVEQVRRAKGNGAQVTCGVTPHHLALIDEDVAASTYHPNWKTEPPLRGSKDREALLNGVYDGTVDVIATDHSARHFDETEMDFAAAPAGIVGLETAVSLALDRLVHARVIGISQLVRLFSTNPAAIYGLPGGTLKVGSVADLTLLDLGKRVTVDSTSFRSKGRNTPFNGVRFKGAPAMTIVDGKVAWKPSRK